MSEAAGSERYIFDEVAPQGVAVGHVGLVQQGSACDGHGGGNLPGLQSSVDGGGAIPLDEDFRMDFGPEAGACESKLISADRQIRDDELAGRRDCCGWAADALWDGCDDGAASGSGGCLLDTVPRAATDSESVYAAVVDEINQQFNHVEQIKKFELLNDTDLNIYYLFNN